MASRSPPLHASQKRRTNSRGVSLIGRTLPASPDPPLLDRCLLLPDGRLGLLDSRLRLDRRLLLDGRLLPRRGRLLARRRRLLPDGRLLLRRCLRLLDGRLLLLGRCRRLLLG